MAEVIRANHESVAVGSSATEGKPSTSELERQLAGKFFEQMGTEDGEKLEVPTVPEAKHDPRESTDPTVVGDEPETPLDPGLLRAAVNKDKDGEVQVPDPNAIPEPAPPLGPLDEPADAPEAAQAGPPLLPGAQEQLAGLQQAWTELEARSVRLEGIAQDHEYWAQLRTTDPGRWASERQALAADRALIRMQAQGIQQGFHQVQAAHQQVYDLAPRARQAETVLTSIQGWGSHGKDGHLVPSKRAAQEAPALRSWLIEQGYNDQQLAAMEPRDTVLAYQAWQNAGKPGTEPKPERPMPKVDARRKVRLPVVKTKPEPPPPPPKPERKGWQGDTERSIARRLLSVPGLLD